MFASPYKINRNTDKTFNMENLVTFLSALRIIKYNISMEEELNHQKIDSILVEGRRISRKNQIEVDVSLLKLI